MLEEKRLKCAIRSTLTSIFIKNKREAGIEINNPRVMQMRKGTGEI